MKITRPGLEPGTREPKSLVLPITPPGSGCAIRRLSSVRGLKTGIGSWRENGRPTPPSPLITGGQQGRVGGTPRLARPRASRHSIFWPGFQQGGIPSFLGNSGKLRKQLAESPASFQCYGLLLPGAVVILSTISADRGHFQERCQACNRSSLRT